jgi:superfamily I DNA/RNA helicase
VSPHLELRLSGPPGSGKTETLRRTVEATAAKYGAERVLVSSFTKAAAREIASRVALPADRVGTLHAHCFRALGRPTIAEGRIDEWNDRVGGSKRLALSGARPDVDDPYGDGERLDPADFGGDELLAEANLLRARLVPVERWEPSVRAWYEQWQGWLHDSGYVDFTGLLEQALALVDFAPGNPAVLFGDELQDNSPLEFALLRKWAARCEAGVYLAGDAAQAIYAWRGASPQLFFTPPLPEENYLHLRQSYRLPRTVLEVAERWLRRSSDAHLYANRHFDPRREDPKDPRSPLVEGAVHRRESLGLGREVGSWKNPEDLLGPLVERAEQRDEPLAIMASCDYLLTPTIVWLRNQGIPFHNPARASNGRWNPMRGGTERLRDFLAGPRPDLLRDDVAPVDARLWTWQEFRRWSELLPAQGFLARGARTQVEARVRDDEKAHRADVLRVEELRGLLAPGVFEQLGPALASERPWQWLQVRVAPKKRAAVDFALNIVHRRGPRALRREPNVVVGSIHSFKGWGFPHVAVFPDLSPSGYAEWDGRPAQKDAVRRVFYVAMSRASQTLTLAGAASQRAVDWDD